jgi:thymidylate kinase
MMHPVILDAIQRLCETLEDEGIAYCHWKSNDVLDRSASGENDLDLLISRSDAQRFTVVLYRLGFKEARPPLAKELPGIFHYYAYDTEADRFVHVHAHYQLVLGNDLTKNFHLPIERPFLESVVRDGLFRVPAPEIELLVFIIRMVLKFSLLDRRVALPASAKRELDYLINKIDRDRMFEALGNHLPFIDRDLLKDCLRSLGPDCSLWTRFKVREQLQRLLSAHARRTRILDTFLKLMRRIADMVRWRVFGQEERKRLINGGAMVALVGGDGSGKSTAVEGVYAWLSKDFDTMQVHMGKPAYSLSTLVVLKFFGLLKKMINFGRSGKLPVLDGSTVFSKYYLLFEYVCTARDRYRLYTRARRFASNGGLVVCDRYPISKINLMDGPKSASLPGFEEASGFPGFLARLEKKYYNHIRSPELMIVLRVNPEIAVMRKTDEESVYVRKRSTEIWELDWGQTNAHVIDAGRSKHEVLAELKSIIWSKL